MRRVSLFLLCGACYGGVASEGEGTSSTSGTSSAATIPTSGPGSTGGTSPTSGAGTGGTGGTTSGTGSTSGASTSSSSTGAGEGSTGAVDPSTDTDATSGGPEAEVFRFALIGDYGLDGKANGQVAALVASWDPEIVLTAGDNNYFDGLASTIDANIGKYYAGFIAPYTGKFGPGADENRFFPCPGNHDWRSGDLKPYLDYFDLPGNERYYSIVRGPVEFFMLDSDPHEPDGLKPTQTQGQWLEAALAESDAVWQVVVMHHAPYSSGYHGGTTAMRWPYAEWGADLVLAGHDHDYERFKVDGLNYLVVGTGGGALRKFASEETGSQRGHANGFGALRVEATEERMTLDFVAVNKGRVDRLTLAAEPPTQWTPRIAKGATWRWHEADPGVGWEALDFDDDGWKAGPAPLGFGVGGEGTVLPGNKDPDDRPITTYFRRRFQAEAGDLGPWLRLRISVDDAAIVYLNGVEVYRINMQEDEVHDDTKASLAVGSWFSKRFAETLIAGEALVVGENILAIEVHQQAPTSSDLRLDLELAAAAE